MTRPALRLLRYISPYACYRQPAPSNWKEDFLMAGTPTISRRSLLQLSAAGAAVLPSANAAGADRPSPLAELIDRHKAAAAALDAACARLDRAEQEVAQKYPADTCRSWLA